MQPAPVTKLYLEQRWTRFDFVTNSADIDPLQSHARAAAACKILANAPAVALSDGQVALAPPRGPIGALALFRAVEVEKLIVGRKGMSRLRLRRRLRDGFKGGSILVEGLCQGVRDKERVQQQTHCEREHSNLGAQHPDTMLLLRVSLSACFFFLAATGTPIKKSFALAREHAVSAHKVSKRCTDDSVLSAAGE